MRSAGCIINDWADRNLDGAVERTKNRPLVTGEISSKEALLGLSVLLSLALGLVCLTNPLTIALAVIAAALTALYPFMKRFMDAPQVILGLAFAWSVPMAFAAQLNHIPPVAWWLFASTVCWVIAYDTIYAMVDRADDLKINIRSTAILFGNKEVLAISIFLLLSLAGWWQVGRLAELAPVYYGGLGLACGQMLYQVWAIRTRDPARCFTIFLSNHQLGKIVFFSALLGVL